MLTRRFAALTLAAALFIFGAPGHAQYPTRPVKLISPFPPGQATDIVARLIADGLSKTWGQNVIVENRVGGNGILAMVAGRDAPPDGYTLVVSTSGPMAVNPSVYAKLPYDVLKDYAMAAGLFLVPLVVVAHPSSPYNSMKEIADAAKKEPGKLFWGYAGPTQQLMGELFKYRAGADITGVSYKGSGPAITDLLGAQITLLVDSVASAAPHLKAGRIRGIAVTMAQRTPQLPDVPTVAETGFPGFEGIAWGGLIAPAATPRDVVEKIGSGALKLLDDPTFRDRLIENGFVPYARDSKAFREFVQAEIEKWSRVAKAANIRAD